MSSQAILPIEAENSVVSAPVPAVSRRMKGTSQPSFRFPAHTHDDEAVQRHAELFYLQKQIQSQTPMVIVLEDGEQVEGQIEWYDRHTLKVRGRAKTLIFKSAIKYMYKLGETNQ
jgi:sRNA-binding regulator protein Hfq